MPFKYQAEKIQEKSFEVLPEGIYAFETIWCMEGLTKAGIDKVVLKLNVFDYNGAKWEHIMHITENNAYHLKTYWDSVGHPEMFEQLQNQHDQFVFIGKCGVVKTKQEENEYNGEKFIRSVVSRFIKKENQAADVAFTDDAIPF